ncbi:hypothetical protein [uncultured Paracoccus sp.]|uniref:hypothetical protein n=1 Tax=uncultured Paracoccus sp. TaxID=189685 RepID=UPI0025DA2D59|nr:hypothetical protein [uncultured Paracoccus sp.]
MTAVAGYPQVGLLTEFNFHSRNGYDDAFCDNVGHVCRGKVYRDLHIVSGRGGDNDLGAIMLGSGIGFNMCGQTVCGIVRAFVEEEACAFAWTTAAAYRGGMSRPPTASCRAAT